MGQSASKSEKSGQYSGEKMSGKAGEVGEQRGGQGVGGGCGAPPPAYAGPSAQPPPPGMYEPPPAYSATLGESSSAVQYAGCIEQQMYQQRYLQQQLAMHPQAQNQPAGMVVHAQFDAGARFSRTSPPSLPPPPPGVAPTPAQIAAMKGGTVIMSQKKETFLEGTGSGGTVFW